MPVSIAPAMINNGLMPPNDLLMRQLFEARYRQRFLSPYFGITHDASLNMTPSSVNAGIALLRQRIP